MSYFLSKLRVVWFFSLTSQLTEISIECTFFNKLLIFILCELLTQSIIWNSVQYQPVISFRYSVSRRFFIISLLTVYINSSYYVEFIYFRHNIFISYLSSHHFAFTTISCKFNRGWALLYVLFILVWVIPHVLLWDTFVVFVCVPSHALLSLQCPLLSLQCPLVSFWYPRISVECSIGCPCVHSDVLNVMVFFLIRETIKMAIGSP